MKEAVIGIVITDDKKIVITKRCDTPIWVLPGGGIDQGETAEKAILREIREETGLQVAIQFKCAEYSPINKLTAKTHIYQCKIIGRSLQTSDETEEVQAFDFDSLPSPFFMLHQDWLNDWKTFQGHLITKEITQVTPLAVIIFFFRHPIILIKFLYNKFFKKS